MSSAAAAFLVPRTVTDPDLPFTGDGISAEVEFQPPRIRAAFCDVATHLMSSPVVSSASAVALVPPSASTSLRVQPRPWPWRTEVPVH